MKPLTVVAPPAQGLLELAENAAVIVVGTRGRGAVAGMMLGSVSLRVAQHAACPAVVLPAGGKAGTEHQIVVGLDGPAPSEAVLSFAVSEAVLHQARLIAGHSVADPYLGSGFMPPAPDLIRAQEETGQQFLHETLEPWRRKHPEIAITDVLIHEPAETALPLRVADADLLVVGAQGRGAFTAMLLGSVSHAVLHAASVPVAVVRGEQPVAQ